MESGTGDKRFVAISTVCEMFDVHPKTIKRWRAKQGFPAPYHITPGSARYDVAAMEKWLRERNAAQLAAA